MDPLFCQDAVARKELVAGGGHLCGGFGELGAVGLRERFDRLIGVYVVLGVADLLLESVSVHNDHEAIVLLPRLRAGAVRPG
ncbi:hypothetical protein ABZ633_26585 [Streptomyces xanthochromogenes]